MQNSWACVYLDFQSTNPGIRLSLFFSVCKIFNLRITSVCHHDLFDWSILQALGRQVGRMTKQTHSPDEQDAHLPPEPSQMQEHPREIQVENTKMNKLLGIVIHHKLVLKIQTAEE